MSEVRIAAVVVLILLYFLAGIAWMQFWSSRVEPSIRKRAEHHYGVKIRFRRYWRVEGKLSFLDRLQLFLLELLVVVGLSGGVMLLILCIFLLAAIPLMNP
jgi:hypothetical protein